MTKVFLCQLLTLGLAASLWAQAPRSYVRVQLAPVLKLPQEGSEQVTQALLSDEVQLLESRGDWLKVYVRPQYRSDKGYPGWLKKAAISKQDLPTSESAVVAVPEVNLRALPDAKAKVVQRASLGTQLSLHPAELHPPAGWLALAIPGYPSPLYAPSKALARVAQPPQDGSLVVATAAQLKGTPYLWGGMSSQGIDCSGLTYTAYRVHGITIPRDADQQFQVGLPVASPELQPGDLLFFGESAEEITHVGMYAGEGKFIHASGSLGGVTLTRFDHPKYSAIFQGARRMLGAEKTLP